MERRRAPKAKLVSLRRKDDTGSFGDISCGKKMSTDGERGRVPYVGGGPEWWWCRDDGTTAERVFSKGHRRDMRDSRGGDRCR